MIFIDEKDDIPKDVIEKLYSADYAVKDNSTLIRISIPEWGLEERKKQ